MSGGDSHPRMRQAAGFAIGVAIVAIGLTLAPVAWASEEEAQPQVGEAMAGEHEGGEEGTPTIDGRKLALQLVNFGVLVFILVKFGGGAINKALAARHQQLKADLAAAAELREAALGQLAKQEARLGSLEQEIAEMRRGIKAEAETEKARLIAAAEERAERIKAETTFMVEQQVREAEVALRREAADAALKVAEEILRRSIVGADQRRFVDTFIEDLEQPGLGAGPSTGAGAGPSTGRPV